VHSKLNEFRERLGTLKATMESKPQGEKKGLIARATADHFNGILKDIADSFPEIASKLPKPITATSMLARNMRLADCSFLDLELLMNDVITILKNATD
jgi:hypothetical protein